MLKYFRPLSPIILLSLLYLDLQGQSQTNFLDVLSEKFNRYCSSIPWEEIYVHSDREEYIAGEDLWFKLYLIDRQSSLPSDKSKVAYVEILNPENRPVVQKRIRLNSGSGAGQTVLPDTLSSGRYTIRAYTNWMKNFMPANCFSKTLIINNALDNRRFVDFSDSQAPAGSAGTIRNLSVNQVPGLKVTTERNRPGTTELFINTSPDFRSVNGNTCYIFIQTHGIINYKTPVQLSEDVVRVEIRDSQLIPGINHITLFNSTGLRVNETYLFTPTKEAGSLSTASADIFKTRDKINIEINAASENASAKKQADLSISVAPAGQDHFPGIDDYMIFGTEFGVLPDEFLISGINYLNGDALSKFLSTLKSSWIDWNTIMSGKFPETKYKRESEYHFMYGRLLNRESQDPDANQYLFLSLPGKNAAFQYARTDKNGDFTFSLPLDENIRELIIQPEETAKNNSIRIETSFSDRYRQITVNPDATGRKMEGNISKMAVNYQITRIYREDELPEKTSSVTFTGGSRRFYGKPDIELIMDDYIKLPVMQEVFFELMPGVFLRKKKDEYEISVSDPVDSRVYDKPPILFVDGVVVRDANIIANLDPELVEKIDAIKSRYFVGDYLFYGMVNVITRAGDFSFVTLPDYAVRLPYRVTEPALSFTSPAYNSPELKQSRVPDFRNTLYWNPSVTTGKDTKTEIQFWTSDLKSDYEVTIQGIDGDGNLVSSSKNIKVR